MKNLMLALILSLFISVSLGQTVKLKKSDFEPQTDAYVQRYLDLDIFSGVVLVAQNGKPVYHKAFGYADRSKKVANTIFTHFDIGSMNKTFTKTAVLQLVRDGLLNLNDKLGQFLDGFPEEASEQVTIGQLLNQKEDTVKKALYRLLARLKGQLEISHV